MEPMNLLVAREIVADDVRRRVNHRPAGKPARTTRITHRLATLLRRALVSHEVKKSAARPRVVSESRGD